MRTDLQHPAQHAPIRHGPRWIAIAGGCFLLAASFSGGCASVHWTAHGGSGSSGLTWFAGAGGGSVAVGPAYFLRTRGLSILIR